MFEELLQNIHVTVCTFFSYANFKVKSPNRKERHIAKLLANVLRESEEYS